MLYGDAGLWAFDIMNADRVRPADLRGLAAFGDEYPEARRILLYRGRYRLVHKGVLCLPVAPFLVALDPQQGLDDAVG